MKIFVMNLKFYICSNHVELEYENTERKENIHTIKNTNLLTCFY